MVVVSFGRDYHYKFGVKLTFLDRFFSIFSLNNVVLSLDYLYLCVIF